MIKLYFKQAFHLLGENKLLSSISIIGTALAIALPIHVGLTLKSGKPENKHPVTMGFRCKGSNSRT